MRTPFELNLPPGLNADDSPFAATGRWADGDCYRFHQGKPETIGAAVELSSSSAMDNVNKMLMFDLAGTITLARAGDKLRIETPNSAGTDITPASDWTAGRRHSLAMFGDVLLASVSGGKLFESVAGAQATEVTNAPDEIICMLSTATRQVMALGCNEEVSGTFNSRCIRFSDIEDYTDWTTASTNNAGEVILPGQEDIVSGCVFGDGVLVWTEGSLWLGRFLGDPIQPWTFDKVGEIGIIGLDAFAVLRQTAYWIGPDGGFYAYTLGALAQRIPCPLSSRLRLASGGLSLESFFACTNAKWGEVWFSVAFAVNGNNATDEAFVFCVDETAAAGFPVWYRVNYNTSPAANVACAIETPLNWEPASVIFGTNLLLHPTGTVKKPYAYDCDSSGNRGISGAYIQSGDFYFDSGKRRAMISRIMPDFDIIEGAVSLTLSTRDDPMQESVTKGPYTLAFAHQLPSALVDGAVASGATSMTVKNPQRARAAGTKFTVVGVNEYDGGDTGTLMVFTVTQDFIGTAGTLHFEPAVVNSGPGRNVVALPANNAGVIGTTRAGKKDFRASGRIMAAKFINLGAFRVRFGKPVFDIVPLGMR